MLDDAEIDLEAWLAGEVETEFAYQEGLAFISGTGANGRPPDTPWDPLAEWVEQAHRRGLELHAWFNPYRARHSSATTPLAANHIAMTDPAVVKRYGDLLWMDPAEPRAAQRMVDVVLRVAWALRKAAPHIGGR
jgi:uncharacterized lipoprotein YddW (UPF0748 family)